MQYWKPGGEDSFAGDMMPYWDGRRFHLFYLLDHGHHTMNGGLGGHVWAHTSSEDLRTWEHHPVAVPTGPPGSCDQYSICTGSVFEHEGVYHAFYATRPRAEDGTATEVVCRAAGRDLIRFDKSPDNPLLAAGQDMDPRSFRDPFVFRHPAAGSFHMLVTTARAPEAQGEGGALAHYTSDDLEHWQAAGAFLQLDADPTPECPEHFFWNGWWYLIYSQWATMQYRVSRDPLGPWRRVGSGTIEPGPNLSVPRTASFTDGRRLAAGFLPWRRDGRDDGDFIYAGNAVFRELVQEEDGSLRTRFVPEMMPATGPSLDVPRQLPLEAQEGQEVRYIPHVPADAVITLTLTPQGGTDEFGLLLRSEETSGGEYRLGFNAHERRMTLARTTLHDLEDMAGPVRVVICMTGSVIDVCINGRHTLVERCFEVRGTRLGLFVQNGAVGISDLSISPIVSSGHSL